MSDEAEAALASSSSAFSFRPAILDMMREVSEPTIWRVWRSACMEKKNIFYKLKYTKKG